MFLTPPISCQFSLIRLLTSICYVANSVSTLQISSCLLHCKKTQWESSALIPSNHFVKLISRYGTLGKIFASVKGKVCLPRYQGWAGLTLVRRLFGCAACGFSVRRIHRRIFFARCLELNAHRKLGLSQLVRPDSP